MSKFKAMFYAPVSTEDLFIFSMAITAADTIVLPLVSTGSYNFTVNWGDGTVQTVTAWNDANATHTYASSATYEVKIDGTCTKFKVANTGTIRTRFREVRQWGNTGLDELNFHGCTNLTVIATDVLDTSGFIATGFISLFQNCTALGNVPNIGSWNTTNITGLNFAFAGCTNFTGDVGAWNTANVTNMFFTFNGCTKFNHSLDGWNVTKVTTFQSMFLGCTIFNQSLNSWVLNTTTNVTMASMFQSCPNFNGNITSWNTIKVTSFASMFQSCSLFNQNIGAWNTSGCTAFNDTFNGCSVFNQDISLWNVSNGTVFTRMFQNAIAFNQNISTWTIKTTGSISFWAMFNVATAFNQPIGSWNTIAVTNMSNMFTGCSVFNQSLNSWNVSAVTLMPGMFKNATAFNANITSWTPSACTNFFEMFKDADAFNQDISLWNVSNGQNFTSMFESSNSFGQDLSTWDIQNATLMAKFGNFGTPFGTTNWSNMLVGWNALPVPPSNITIDMTAGYFQGSVDSGTADGTAANKLIDSTQNFLTTVSIGDIVRKTGNDTYAQVTNVDSDTQLTLDNDIMVSGNAYVVQGSSAAKARYSLKNTYNWTINDGGPV